MDMNKNYNGKAAIRIENLAFGYGKPDREAGRRQGIFENMSLEMFPGQAISVLGPNGSGKSTLIHLICGLLKPLAGSVLLAGNDIAGMRSHDIAKIVSFVPQEHRTAFGFSVREIIEMGRAPFQNFMGFGAECGDGISTIAERLEIGDYLDLDYTKLSGGERKRVLLARALAQDTPIMVFDEPEAHLDIRLQHKFLRHVLELASSENRLCIFSAHSPNLALRYSTRALLLGGGRESIIFGATEEIVTPKNLGRIYGVEFETVTRESGRKLLGVK